MAKPRTISNIVRIPDNTRPAFKRAYPAKVIVLPMIRYGAPGIPDRSSHGKAKV